MFFDFSSAFNTIQPALLGDKLGLAGVNQHLTSWILDYLTNQPQYVRTQVYVLDTIICSTGDPQGTVLASFLFTLYTVDFDHNSPHCHLQKFSTENLLSFLFLHHLVNFLNTHINYLYLKSVYKNLLLIMHHII